MLFQDYDNAIRRLIWHFECWRVEIESARAEERRKKEFDREVRRFKVFGVLFVVIERVRFEAGLAFVDS